jgi:hypothetical protein
VSKRVKLLLLAPLLAVALASFVVVRSQQQGGAGLIAHQRQAVPLPAGSVASMVRAAPDPVTGAHGRQANCTPRGSGELHNPWRCTIRYPTGRVIQYRVTINPGGTYSGDREIVRYRGRTYPDTGRIAGCCISIP